MTVENKKKWQFVRKLQFIYCFSIHHNIFPFSTDQKTDDQRSNTKDKAGLSLNMINGSINAYKSHLHTNNEDLKCSLSYLNNSKKIKHNVVTNAIKSNIDGRKFERIVSAKAPIPVFIEHNSNTPTSPLQFQSLQTDVVVNSDIEVSFQI